MRALWSWSTTLTLLKVTLCVGAALLAAMAAL